MLKVITYAGSWQIWGHVFKLCQSARGPRHGKQVVTVVANTGLALPASLFLCQVLYRNYVIKSLWQYSQYSQVSNITILTLQIKPEAHSLLTSPDSYSKWGWRWKPKPVLLHKACDKLITSKSLASSSAFALPSSSKRKNNAEKYGGYQGGYSIEALWGKQYNRTYGEGECVLFHGCDFEMGLSVLIIDAASKFGSFWATWPKPLSPALPYPLGSFNTGSNFHKSRNSLSPDSHLELPIPVSSHIPTMENMHYGNTLLLEILLTQERTVDRVWLCDLKKKVRGKHIKLWSLI